MQLFSKKRIEIIAESTLQSRLCNALEVCGAKGYTTTPASGKGVRGIRSGDGVVEANGNVQIITVVSPELLEPILETCQQLLEDYAGAIWVSDVQVLRDDHF
jgi:nitrogen regulatory protein PII